MVAKLVTVLLVPFALVYADADHPYHPAPYSPVPHHAPAHHAPAPYGHAHHAPDPYAPPPHHAPHHPAPHSYCDPKAAPACAANIDVPFCVEDPEYPAYEIADKVAADPIFLKKYSDVPDQTADDLVQDITAPQEAAFDYNYYTGASKGPSPYDASHWIGPEGYLCPSQVDYVKIHRALNVEGFWRVILQHVPHHGPHHGYGHSYNYTQTTRLEACLTPDSACRLLAPCYGSKCTQKFIYHRMLSYDPCDPYRGFFMDTYKLPSACSCHIPDGPTPVAAPALVPAPEAARSAFSPAAPVIEGASLFPVAAPSEPEPVVVDNSGAY